ncbi:recQ-mediated genome instability protein 1 [Dissophora ornata]|nr:recQ-mediated genome instability protein 1 [Dissophora ornata]
MSNDDLLVRNAIQRMGVNASVEWTRQCIAYKHKLDASPSNFSARSQDLPTFIFDMHLLTDFRILESKPILPSSIATPHKQRLFNDFGSGSSQLGRTGGGVILQILEIQDIGISSFKMLESCEGLGVAGDQPGGFQIGKALPRGMIILDVTDGVRKMRAMLMEPIFGIAMEMKLGAKIRVRDVEVRHGVLQLNPNNTILLGGEVASMNQHPRRLAIMNQMKQRLSLPVDAMPAATCPSLPGTQTLRPYTTVATTTTIVFNGNNNINGMGTANGVWRNPQAAVTAQDAVASTTPTTWRAPAVTEDTPNPWRSFKPARNFVSPPPQPPASDRQHYGDEQDEYLQMQRDQEPQWGFHNDMDMDYGLHDNDADWGSMSQLSMDMDMKQHQQKDGSEGIESGNSDMRATGSQWKEQTDSRNKKRRVTPEYESSDQDFYTNRRRSRSFSTSQRIDEELEDKVKPRKKDETTLNSEDGRDNDFLLDIKKEVLGNVNTRSNADNIFESNSEDMGDRDSPSAYLAPPPTSGAMSITIKAEKMEASKLEGSTYFAAIDLSSDDDADGDGEETQLPSTPDKDIAGLDILTKIKLEPGVGSRMDRRTDADFIHPSPLKAIKQEETLLEFDMDDEDDFGGLSEVVHVVPEVDLDQVEKAVRDGREARVNKLGKFSLTTLAVSIPIFLLPVDRQTPRDPAALEGFSTSISDTKLEAVLDQKVVELLLEYSIVEFRNLVRVNEPEAKRAVAKMRAGLSEVESIECQFKGLRNNIPVIRELKVLSKKRR